MKRIKQNLLYQFGYQLISLLLPVISMPLITGRIGANGLGQYHYVVTVINYFLLSQGLGIFFYGTRLVAKVADDQEERNRAFSQLFYLNLALSFVTSTGYFIFLWWQEFSLLFCIQTLSILSTAFDISWYFFGVQKMKSIVIRNLVLKILTFAGILLFVQSEQDLPRYLLINAGSLLLSQGSLWWRIDQEVQLVAVTFTEVASHLKEVCQLFITRLQGPLMEGGTKLIVAGVAMKEVGYLGLLFSIIWLVRLFSTSLNQVLMAQMSKLADSRTKEKLGKPLSQIIQWQFFTSLPIMLGLMAICDKLIPWFLGADFATLTDYLPMMTPLIILQNLQETIDLHYLIPKNRLGQYGSWILVGIGLSFVINLWLIPQLGLLGGIISLNLAYLLVVISRLVLIRRIIVWGQLVKKISPMLLASGLMCLLTKMVTVQMPVHLTTTLWQLLIGITSYFILIAVLKAWPKFSLE